MLPFGLPSWSSCVLGVLAVAGAGLLAARFVRPPRLAGGACAAALALSFAFLSSAAHPEPALVGVVAALAAAHALAGALAVRGIRSVAFVFASGLLAGFLAGGCPLVTACAPFAVAAAAWAFWQRRRAWGAVLASALLAGGFALGFLAFAILLGGGAAASVAAARRALFVQFLMTDGGLARFGFAVVPFAAASIFLAGGPAEGALARRRAVGHLSLAVLVAFGFFADFTSSSVASAAFVALAFAETLCFFVGEARAEQSRSGAVLRWTAAAALAAFAVVASVRAVGSFAVVEIARARVAKGDVAGARAVLAPAVRSWSAVSVAREALLGFDIALNDPAAAEADARAALRLDAASPMANYVIGSLSLGRDDLVAAENHLRKAVLTERPGAFALNDLAETLRLRGDLPGALVYARRAVAEYPGLYAAWDTLASVLLDGGGSADAARAAAEKAVELAGGGAASAVDAALLITLARAQSAQGDTCAFWTTVHGLEGRADALTPRQRQDFEKLLRPSSERKSGK